MTKEVKIAVDAMGGENSPKKILNGIEISLRRNNENFFYLHGNEDLLKKEVYKSKLLTQHCEIINIQLFFKCFLELCLTCVLNCS